MNYHSNITFDRKWNVSDWISCLFAVLVFGIGVLNLFWGNDPGFGAFLLLLSFLYFPPATALLRKMTGISVHPVVKIILALFIIWASLGVGELFDKLDLMLSGR